MVGMRILWVAATLSVGLIAFIALNGREQGATEEVKGAISIKRIRCEPASSSTYGFSFVAQNTTDRALKGVVVKFTFGKPGNLTVIERPLPVWLQGEFSEVKTSAPLSDDVTVCSVKFYTASGKSIASAYRP